MNKINSSQGNTQGANGVNNASKMSAPQVNSPQAQKQAESESKDDDKGSKQKVIAVTLAALAIAATAALLIYNRRKVPQKLPEMAADDIRGFDVNSFNFKAPQSTELVNKTFFEQTGGLRNVIGFYEEASNEVSYARILTNIMENPEAMKCFEDTAISIGKNYDSVIKKLAGYLEKKVPEDFETQLLYSGNYTIQSNGKLSGEIKYFAFRDMLKKINYTDTGSSSTHYSKTNPLNSQKAREEIVDTYLGYIMAQREWIDRRAVAKDDKLLRFIYEDLLKANLKKTDFLEKMRDAKHACGSGSEVHTYELIELGSMVRKFFGIAVD